MARVKAATARQSKATMQNACFWLAMRPELTDLTVAVDLVKVLFDMTDDEVAKRIATVKQMVR